MVAFPCDISDVFKQWLLVVLSELNQKHKVMCFGVSSIKLFLNSCSLKNLSNIKNKGWQQRDLWSYANDAIRMKRFY